MKRLCENDEVANDRAKMKLEPTAAFVSLAVDSSGNVFGGGYTTGGLDGNTQTGADDFFIFKYDTSGNLQ